MPTRRQFLLIICALLSLSAWFATGKNTSAANFPLTAYELQDTLYAKTKAEYEYCELVIRMRNQGVLPNKILYYAYKKAIRQEKTRRFVYFKRVLELACDKQGIVFEESDSVKVKKFFGFKSISSKPTEAANTATTTPTLTKPALQDTLTKPFTSIQQLFTR